MPKMEINRRLLAALACIFLFAGCEAIPSGEPDTVIFLVRHAEKEKGPNPPLTAAGKARAVELASRLEGERLQYIHSTDYARTRQTAAPASVLLELDVKIYDPRDLPAFASKLKAQGGRHLVVGHSNTTPVLVAELGGDPGTPIDEASEYDRLYVVVISADGRVSSRLERYGRRYQP